MIGDFINDRYRVEAEIGKGGFGIVYRCVDHLDRNVALKMLRASRSDTKMIRRFESESRKLAALNHTNVVQVYDFGYWKDHPYIVMEFLEGQTLDRLVTNGSLGATRAVEIMQQVACGLEAIHSAGLIHRDLKPNNILVPGRGVPKILDLGLAKGLEAAFTMTSESAIVGTPSYMSPEQLQGIPLSYASDIFSFGILLYEAVAGQYPFGGEHPSAVLYAIAHRDAPPLAESVHDCPPRLSELVGRCLSKRPEDRPETMSLVRDELEHILRSKTLDTVSQSPTISLRQKPRQTPRNPYLNRVMIQRRGDFYGREQEVKRIYSRLNASHPGSVSLVGEPKIGKSSLLNYVYMPQNRQEYLDQPDRTIMLFLDFQQESRMSMETFVRTLIGMASIEIKDHVDLSNCGSGLDGVRGLVHRLNESGYRIALLMDGFEAVTRNENFDLEFFSFLRFLANHYDVAYITSSSRALQILCHTQEIADSPFFNIFSTMRLGLFEPEEALQLVMEPSQRVGRPLSPYRDAIVEMAGRFPFFLQMACSHAIEYLEQYPDQELDLRELRRRFDDEAIDEYNHIWDNLEDEERRSLADLATDRRVPDSQEYVIPELRRKAYIEEIDGVPRLFSASFRDFVRSRSGERRSGFFRRLFGGSSG